MKAAFVSIRSVLSTTIAIAIGGDTLPFAGAIAIAPAKFCNIASRPACRRHQYGAASPLFSTTISKTAAEIVVDVHVEVGSPPSRFARWGRGVRRPDVNDVVRVTVRKPSSKKGTRLRAVSHRLDADERILFDLARRRGFLEITAGGTFERRSAAPLPNTYRSLCDARGQPSIVLRKGHGGGGAENNNNNVDEVVCDLSPLRDPAKFEEVARLCLDAKEGGETSLSFLRGGDSVNLYGGSGDEMTDPWRTRPIHRLPPRCVWWTGLERGEAQKLGKALSNLFGTAEKNCVPSTRRPVGVRHGKSRRSI